MLTPEVTNVSNPGKNKPSPAPPIGYGLGWFVRPAKKGLMGGIDYPLIFSHTGGAVGCSSILTIIPDQSDSSATSEGLVTPPLVNRQPKGVVVAVILNLQNVKGLFKLGVRIAEEFRTII